MWQPGPCVIHRAQIIANGIERFDKIIITMKSLCHLLQYYARTTSLVTEVNGINHYVYDVRASATCCTWVLVPLSLAKGTPLFPADDAVFACPGEFRLSFEYYVNAFPLLLPSSPPRGVWKGKTFTSGTFVTCWLNTTQTILHKRQR